jgi:dienelactone hydrolase
VLFPRYQLGGVDNPDVARLTSLRQGLALGFARLGKPRVPVVAAGYSFGASLAYYYAGDARSWHLPQPVAVDLVFPAGLIAGARPRVVPARVRVLVQVGDRDTEAGAAGAAALWAALAGHPRRRRRYVVVRSEHGLAATHPAPKLVTPAAERAFWAPLDRLILGRL